MCYINEMRFKEFMNNQGFQGDPQMGSARDYYPELKPFDQPNSGKMLMHMMREKFVTLQKLRKLVMNIIESINLACQIQKGMLASHFKVLQPMA